MRLRCIKSFTHASSGQPQVHAGTFYTMVRDYSCNCTRYHGLLEFPWPLPPSMTLEANCRKCGTPLPSYPGYYMWPAKLFVPVDGDPLGVKGEQEKELTA